MKFSIWHLFALTAYAAVSVAILSTELTELTGLIPVVLTILYGTLAVAFVVFGKPEIRAFAIGASVPLGFLLAVMFFAVGIAVIDGPGPPALTTPYFRWVIGISWLLNIVCGLIVLKVRSYANRTLAPDRE